MDYRLNPCSQKVQEYLGSAGVDAQVREMPATTRTAKEAAQAIGCCVAQIAKSMFSERHHPKSVKFLAPKIIFGS